jgi:hypothetical protein
MTGNNRNTRAGKKGHAKRQNKKKNSNQNKQTVSSMQPRQIKTGVSMTRQVNNRDTVLRGSDFITSFKLAHDTDSRVLVDELISPSAMRQTRLFYLANLWEMYRFTKFSVRYVPALPDSVGGQIAGYIDTDPTDTVTEEGEDLIRATNSQTGVKQWNVSQGSILNMARRKDDQMFYTGLLPSSDSGPSDRQTYQGRLYVVQMTKPMNYLGQPLTEDISAGSLYVDWEIVFRTPQLEPIAPTGNYGEGTTAHINNLGTATHVEQIDFRQSAAIGMRSISNGLADDGNVFLQPRVILHDSTGAVVGQLAKLLDVAGKVEWNFEERLVQAGRYYLSVLWDGVAEPPTEDKISLWIRYQPILLGLGQKLLSKWATIQSVDRSTLPTSIRQRMLHEANNH